MSEEIDFFILGAPKCGTTAVASWLSAHPDLYIPKIKEPNYFCNDLDNAQVASGAEYFSLFDAADSGCLKGDASVWYLYSSTAAELINNKYPSARYVVCVRNPIELAVSLHNQNKVASIENVVEFQKAWQMQEKRRHGEHVPVLCSEPKMLLYGSISKVGKQLDRLYKVVNSSQVLVVFLEDIKENPLASYKSILKHLGVDYDGRLDFNVVNGASERRWSILSKSLRIYSMVRKKIGIPRLNTGIMLWADKINRKRKKNDQLDEVFNRELVAYFRDDINLLENLTQRDLSHWKS